MSKKNDKQVFEDGETVVDTIDGQSPEGDTAGPKKTRARTIKVSKYAGKGKQITVPLLKLNSGDTIAVKFTGETRQMQIGKDPKKGDATLYRVIDLDTGEISDLIGPTVLNSTIEKTYPEGSYKDKSLVLRCDQREGKGYLDVFVSELE